MDILTAIFVFILVWWVVIFTVLPWGNKAFDNPEIGHAASAPANPRIKQKLLVTTLISVVLTVLLVVVTRYFDISFYEVVKQWSIKE
jgi:predicted secreted protein